MLKVGLSGKIASGKSEVERIIQKFGFLVFDLDKISAEVFNDKKISIQILNEFKTLNKKEIAEIIFSDSNKRQKLENIIHPELKNKIIEIFEENKNEKAVFMSGALLFKTGFYKLFDKNIFIDAFDEIRLERLIKRDNLDYELAIKRLNLQDEENKADFIIQNNADKISLEKEVKEVLNQLF